MNDHLDTPEEPELLDRGVIWTTQVLPQLVGVTHAVVKVIGDIDQTWRRMEMREEQSRMEMRCMSWRRFPSKLRKNDLIVPVCDASPLSEMMTSSVSLEVRMSSLL